MNQLVVTFIICRHIIILSLKKHTFKEIGIYSFNKYILPLTMCATVDDTGKVLRITWLHHGYSSCTQRHKTGYSSECIHNIP